MYVNFDISGNFQYLADIEYTWILKMYWYMM